MNRLRFTIHCISIFNIAAEASVDRQVDSGNPRGTWRSKECDDIGHFLWGAEAARGLARQIRRAKISEQQRPEDVAIPATVPAAQSDLVSA